MTANVAEPGPHYRSNAVTASQYTAVELGRNGSPVQKIYQKQTTIQRKGGEPKREPWHLSCTGSALLLPQFLVK